MKLNMRVTLTWNNSNDLDLFVNEPNGFRIQFNEPNSLTGGKFYTEVTCNIGCNNTSNRPIESIYWPSGKAPLGLYTVYVHYYNQINPKSTKYLLVIKVYDMVAEYRGVLTSVNEAKSYKFEV